MNLNSPVSEIMISKLETVQPQQLLVDVKHIFEHKKFHHHIPVVQDKKLVGMISTIDFVHAMKDASIDDNEPVYQQKVSDIMRTNPVSKSMDTSIREITEELMKGEVHAIAITDEKNNLHGIISSVDVLGFLMGLAEVKP